MKTASPNALKDLLYRLADDALIIGHRNSEWTGFGPILEEDIAFSSMAQDEIGQSLSYYRLLESLGEGEPDQVAFMRPVAAYRCCHLVEYPIGDYAFSLVRHFFYDYAKDVRLAHLVNSTYAPLAELAHKIIGEQKYHTLHARTWITQLGQGTEESRLRIQSAIVEAYPAAYGLFETTEYAAELAECGVCPMEETLAQEWIARITHMLSAAGLQLPATFDSAPYLGGRNGYHSEYLQPLLDEMTVVFKTDPQAIW